MKYDSETSEKGINTLGNVISRIFQKRKAKGENCYSNIAG